MAAPPLSHPVSLRRCSPAAQAAFAWAMLFLLPLLGSGLVFTG